jgi:hypothetical protein
MGTRLLLRVLALAATIGFSLASPVRADISDATASKIFDRCSLDQLTRGKTQEEATSGCNCVIDWLKQVFTDDQSMLYHSVTKGDIVTVQSLIDKNGKDWYAAALHIMKKRIIDMNTKCGTQ